MPSPKSSVAVLFDLDGTLIDSLPGILGAYHHLLAELRLGNRSDEEIRQLVGQNVSLVLEEQFGLSGDQLTRGVTAFREHYGSHGLFQYSKYDGIDSALVDLSSNEIVLCIATSKLRHMACDVVRHAGWSGTFEIVSGAEADGSRVHKRDIMSWSLDQLPRGARAVAMVGDRAVDIESSKDLGLIGIGVTWGYGDRTELTSAGASLIVDSPQDLVRALHQCM